MFDEVNERRCGDEEIGSGFVMERFDITGVNISDNEKIDVNYLRS